MQLTANFSLAEFTRSDTATRRGLDNTPDTQELANLNRLALVLEEIRAGLGHHPIHITSGFRGEALNRAVGGDPNSAHRLGLAADFICPGYGSPFEVCRAIAAMAIEFDQLIQEKNRWVHLGLSPGPGRRDLLTFDGQRYLRGIRHA